MRNTYHTLAPVAVKRHGHGHSPLMRKSVLRISCKDSATAISDALYAGPSKGALAAKRAFGKAPSVKRLRSVAVGRKGRPPTPYMQAARRVTGGSANGKKKATDFSLKSHLMRNPQLFFCRLRSPVMQVARRVTGGSATGKKKATDFSLKLSYRHGYLPTRTSESNRSLSPRSRLGAEGRSERARGCRPPAPCR